MGCGASKPSKLTKNTEEDQKDKKKTLVLCQKDKWDGATLELSLPGGKEVTVKATSTTKFLEVMIKAYDAYNEELPNPYRWKWEHTLNGQQVDLFSMEYRRVNVASAGFDGTVKVKIEEVAEDEYKVREAKMYDEIPESLEAPKDKFTLSILSLTGKSNSFELTGDETWRQVMSMYQDKEGVPLTQQTFKKAGAFSEMNKYFWRTLRSCGIVGDTKVIIVLKLR
mmetsp:Transcript_10793/g.12843  ORF Transcript_10793/g.12843 Transcript_10793/m.12843 type:complete len:224 (+) Transcript_10793:49-720(+)|eukprot:jgi/Bigna1/84293/fgenesh1_pg.128_\